jgi:hypothetical protein
MSQTMTLIDEQRSKLMEQKDGPKLKVRSDSGLLIYRWTSFCIKSYGDVHLDD